MSAFLCSNRHLNAMLQYAASRELKFYLSGAAVPLHANNRAHAQELGELIQSLNIDAMQERYPEWGESEAPAFVLALKSRSFVESPAQVIKLCLCWEYQCCGLESFETTDAARIVRNIRDAATVRIDGYNEAQWSFD